MTPYYQDDFCTLYCGDSRRVMTDLRDPDLIVTDPPYGLGDKWVGGGGSAGTSWKFNPKEAASWDATTVDFVNNFHATPSIIWGGNYYTLPPSRGWLIWDKKQNDSFTTGQAEMAWTNFDIPVRIFRFAQCEQASEGPKFHPTQKPIALMTWCFKWCPPGSVLDPFCGSGTTLVAAKLIGRKSVGIEIDEDYCAIAKQRLMNTPPTMFP